jgi:hypothetical protein
LSGQDESTTNGIPKELIPLELEKVQQSPVKNVLAGTGLLLGLALPTSECNGTFERVGTHPITNQVLIDSESTGSVARETPARLLSSTGGTSMISKAVPPEAESTGSILRATASSTGHTSELAPQASESVKSIRKGTPSSLLSRRSKSRSVSSLSIRTDITKEKARLEEMSMDLFAKEVKLDNEEIFESDKENMTPANSCDARNKAGRKDVRTTGETKEHIGFTLNSSSKLTTHVLVRKGVKKSGGTLCVSGKSNKNGESVSLNSREILSEAKANESCASTKEKVTQKLFASRSLKKSRRNLYILGGKQQSDESCSKVLHKNENSPSEKRNCNLQVPVRKSAKKSEKTVHAVTEMIQVERSAGLVLFENCGENENFASDKENATPISSSTESKYRLVSKSPGRALFQNVDLERVKEENSENFASDKENCTPDSKLTQKSRQHLFEGHAMVDIEIGEKKKMERVPFKVLFDNNICVPRNSPLKPLCTIPDNSSVVSSFFFFSITDYRTSFCPIPCL